MTTVPPESKCTGCGCTEETPCPSRCARVRKDLCSECLPLDPPEVALMLQVLMETSANLVDLPWAGFLRALDTPEGLAAALPPRLSQARRDRLLLDIRAFAEQANRWKAACLDARKAMEELGPQVTPASPSEVPPPPRILRP